MMGVHRPDLPGEIAGFYTREAFTSKASTAVHPDGAPRPRAVLTAAKDLKAVPIDWLWPGWLAAGKLHVLGGQPGTGKTTLAMKMAAVISRGGTWPDGRFAPVGNVIIWSGEDDPADTLLPRLLAAGADPERVFFVTGLKEGTEERPFDPARDMPVLRETVAGIPNVKLIVCDPIVSAVAGDSHKNAETRRALAPLVDLAADRGAALVGITHFSKGTAGREPVERITGSLAFGALARVVMVAAKETEGEDGTGGRRIFARAKSNIGPDDGGFAYRLDQVPMPGDDRIAASVVTFGDRIEGSARDMLAAAEGSPEDGPMGSAKADAEAFLLDVLLNDPTPTKQVKAAAAEAGLAWATVRRAKDTLKVVARKEGMDGGWLWSLPKVLTGD